MSSRMDKYKNTRETEEYIPTRSDKNKELYKQIYNAYDEFENLVVPSNAREINPSELKKEITSRGEYQRQKEYNDITNTNNRIVRKEKLEKHQKQENEIYDIKELLNKAVTKQDKPQIVESTLTNEDYLKKLKLDNSRTNIEQVKEMYEEIQEEQMDEEEGLLKTANLSLEILSDLKSDNDGTMVNPPIKKEELPDDDDSDFYSSKYKFSKKDFEDKRDKGNIDDEMDEDDEESGNGKFFFKILLLIFGILLVLIVIIYLFNYFNRV